MLDKPSMPIAEWARNTAVIQEPSDTKKDIGWLIDEKPPAQWFNWILKSLCVYVKYLVDKTDEISRSITPADSPDQIPIGFVIPFAGSIAPDKYLICNGSEISKSLYNKLYNIIGDSYGTAGDPENFKLPSAAGRTIIGAGLGLNLTQRNIGDKGGTEAEKLGISQIPSHSHTISDNHTHSVTDAGHSHNLTDNGHTHNTSGYSIISRGQATCWRPDGSGAPESYALNINSVSTTNSSNQTTNSKTGITINNSQSNISIDAKTGSISLNTTGGDQAHNNMPPYLVMNYIIKAQ